MELRDMRYLVTIAREGSISAAAESLSMSQPNLSRQMSALERELGVRLLERGNRRTELTEEGRRLLVRAEQMLELEELARDEVSTSEGTIIGTVRIGGGEAESLRTVFRAAANLRRKHPGVDFDVHSGNAQDVTELLDRGLLDFGVLIEPVDKSKYDFMSISSTVGWGVLVRRDHPLASHACVSPCDLQGVPLIVSRQKMAWNVLSGWMGPGTSKVTVVATYNLLYNASLMVSEGLGCAICLEGIVNTEGTDLRFIPLDPPLEAGLVLVWRRGWMPSRQAAAFLEEIRCRRSDTSTVNCRVHHGNGGAVSDRTK